MNQSLLLAWVDACCQNGQMFTCGLCSILVDPPSSHMLVKEQDQDEDDDEDKCIVLISFTFALQLAQVQHCPPTFPGAPMAKCVTVLVAKKAIHLEVCMGDTTESLMDLLFKQIRARPPHLTFCKKKVKAGLYLYEVLDEGAVLKCGRTWNGQRKGPRPLSKRALQLHCTKNKAETKT